MSVRIHGRMIDRDQGGRSYDVDLTLDLPEGWRITSDDSEVRLYEMSVVADPPHPSWRITSAPEPSAAHIHGTGLMLPCPACNGDPVSAPSRHSEPLGLAQAARGILLDKLMAHMEQNENGCWLWTGSVDADGYGMLKHGDRPYRAHRLAYRLFVGEPEHSVLHKCDTPACFNPTHLYDGTHRDNARDAFARGQLARGERNGQAKLTEAQVAEVRRLYGQGVGPRELAERFGVHRQTIRLVIRGETWPTT